MSTLSPHPPTPSSEPRLADRDSKLVRVPRHRRRPAAVVAAIDEAGYDAVTA